MTLLRNISSASVHFVHFYQVRHLPPPRMEAAKKHPFGIVAEPTAIHLIHFKFLDCQQARSKTRVSGGGARSQDGFFPLPRAGGGRTWKNGQYVYSRRKIFCEKVILT